MAKLINKDYPEIDNIREDLDSLKSNTVDLARHVRDDAAVQTSEIRKSATDRLEKLLGLGKANIAKLEDHAREKPMQTLAIAFVAGMAASIFMNRR